MDHPNIALLKRFDPNNVAETAEVFSEDAVFHFFNPELPEIHGDYVGREGVKTFFEKLAQLTGEDFEINLVSATAVGDELVVIHRKQKMAIEGRRMESDVVVVWRMGMDKLLRSGTFLPFMPCIFHRRKRRWRYAYGIQGLSCYSES